VSERKDAASRREGILAAAMEVFDAHGFAGTTIDAVAEHAGIAKGSVYNYFPSKHDLFYQVLSHTMGAVKADTGAMFEDAGLGPPEKLRRLLDYWSDQLPHFMRFGRLVLEFWAAAAREDEQGDLAAALGQYDTYWLDQLASVVAGGVRSGDFIPGLDPRASAAMILMTLDGLMLNAILGTGLALNEGAIEAVKQSILTWLTCGKDMPAGESGRRGDRNE